MAGFVFVVFFFLSNNQAGMTDGREKKKSTLGMLGREPGATFLPCLVSGCIDDIRNILLNYRGAYLVEGTLRLFSSTPQPGLAVPRKKTELLPVEKLEI